MRTPLLVFIVLALSTIAFGQTCKSNQYDMLDWMAPQQPTVDGHYNVLYPNTRDILLSKEQQGVPVGRGHVRLQVHLPVHHGAGLE
jgi:hypothetical protein